MNFFLIYQILKLLPNSVVQIFDSYLAGQEIVCCHLVQIFTNFWMINHKETYA